MKYQSDVLHWLTTGRRRALLLLLLVLSIGVAIHVIDERRQVAALPALPVLHLRADSQPVVQKQLRAALEAVRSHPGHAGLNARLGMVLQAYDYPEAAAICYRRAYTLEPDFGAAYLLGLALGTTGDTTQAIVALRDALRINPRYWPAALKLAELLMEAGEPEASRELYESLLRQVPESPYVHFGYGRLLVATGEMAAAIDHLQQAIVLSRASGNEFGLAHYALGQAHRAGGDGQAAERQLALYEKYRDARPPREDPVLLAVQQLRQDDQGRFETVKQLMTEEKLQEARELLEQILADQPDNAAAHANLIGVLGKLGDLEQAREHYHAALLQNPDSAQIHYVFGAMLSEHGHLEEARETLMRAVDSNPHYVAARVRLGLVLEQLGDTAAAEAQYRKALQDEPHNWQANALLAQQLIGTGRYREAIGHLERIVDQDATKTPAVHHSLAVAYRGLGEQESAIRHLEAARSGAEQLDQTELLEAVDRELARLNRGGPVP